MKIRKAQSGDEAMVASVWYEMVISGEPHGLKDSSLKDRDTCVKIMTERFAHAIRMQDQLIVVAEDDGAVVGYAAASISHTPTYREDVLKMTLYSVSVTASRRGQGIGAAIMQEVESIAREKGVAVLLVDSVHHRNRAVDFYESAGFAKRDLIMVKHL